MNCERCGYELDPAWIYCPMCAHNIDWRTMAIETYASAHAQMKTSKKYLLEINDMIIQKDTHRSIMNAIIIYGNQRVKEK